MNNIPSHNGSADRTATGPGLFRIMVTVAFLVIFSSISYGQNDTLIRGVQISYKTENKMFPCSWHKKKISAEAEALRASEIPRAAQILDHALSKYPESLPRQYLEKLYVLKSMKFYGYP